MEPNPEPQLAKRFPDCLRWKADRHEREDQLRELPSVLFAQLRHALLRVGHEKDHFNFPSLGIPNKCDLDEAWRNRPGLGADALDVTEAMIEDWLRAYGLAWWEQEAPGLADDISEMMESTSYIEGCADILLGRTRRVTIPIVAVDGERSGRVQVLQFDVVRNKGEAALYMHPESEFARSCFSAEFLSGIEKAWQLATGESLRSVTVFWHITETDGRPIISEQQGGTSASAAAFRTFWHVRRGLSLDPEVYVLGSCASADGSVQDVGGIAQKIVAVREHRLVFGIETPGTLVVSAKQNGRTQHDLTAIAQSESWAVVHQVSTCDELTAVRSCESAAAIAYLWHLADELDQCRLLPSGKRLSEVHVPPQVWKDERIRPEHEAGCPDYLETDPANGPEDRDSPPKKRRVRQPWDRVFQMHRGRSPLVLVGGPGSGKSTVLHWTALEMAREAAAMLESRTVSCAKVSWPVLMNLDTWATHEPRQQPRASLVSLITGTVLQDQPPHNREALTRLIEKRLTSSVAHTWLFLDSLDQVAAARGPLLARRLAALNDLTTRLVLTTRESGLRTHDETMKTLQNPTIVQSASLTAEDARALAAKWLGPEQAARLKRHLRSHPSLSIVADSPLLLTLACLVVSENGRQTLPETPAELYQAMLLLLAQGRWRSTDDAPPVCDDPQALLDQLPAIAWRLFVRNPGVNRFNRTTMLDAIQQATGLKGKPATDFLDQQFVELGFVEAAEAAGAGQYYQFRHTSLLEFLAGRHLATTIHLNTWASSSVDSWQTSNGWQSVKVADLIDAQAFEPGWEPVIVFAAGQMQEPLPLIEMLADRKKDDLYRHRLGLLCRCFRSLSSSFQTASASAMEPIFKEVVRIAKRCQHDDSGHRKPWLDWVEVLAPSPVAIERLCDELLELNGRYHGWTVAGKVQDLLERVLVRGNVPPSVIDSIAALGVSGRHEWSVNTLKLALSLANDHQRAQLEKQFDGLLDCVAISKSVKLRAAEAIVAFGSQPKALRACDFLIAMVQAESATKFGSDAAIHKLLGLLDHSTHAPVAAALLIENLLNPFITRGTGNQYSSFWLAWKLIERAESTPENPWSSAFLTAILYADHEEDGRLKRWAAQVLAQRSESALKVIGLQTLRCMVEGKKRDWVHAARWLVENQTGELADQARQVMLTEATNHNSDDHKYVTAQLLEMRLISPTGEPIQEAIREAALHELNEHGAKYGSRLHVSAPGLPDGNLDLEFFEDNPVAVIKRLHTFNGPSFYNRDRDDPNDEEKKWRYSNAQLLCRSRHWPKVFECSIREVWEGADPDNSAGLSIVLFGATGSALLELLQTSIRSERKWKCVRHYLLGELYERGWRLRLRGRKIEVLRHGLEEPRSDADFGY